MSEDTMGIEGIEGRGGSRSHPMGRPSLDQGQNLHAPRELGFHFGRKEKEDKRSLLEVMARLNEINNNPAYVIGDPGPKASSQERRQHEEYLRLKARQAEIYAACEDHPSMEELRKQVNEVERNSAQNDILVTLTHLRNRIEAAQKDKMDAFPEKGLVGLYVGDVERNLELALAQELANIARTNPRLAESLERELVKRAFPIDRKQVPYLIREQGILGLKKPNVEITNGLGRMAKITLGNLAADLDDDVETGVVGSTPPSRNGAGAENSFEVKPEKMFLDLIDDISTVAVDLTALAGYDENGTGSVLIGKSMLSPRQTMYFEKEAAKYLRRSPGAMKALIGYWKVVNLITDGSEEDRFKAKLGRYDSELAREVGCTREEASRARAILTVSGFPQGVPKLGVFLTNYPGLWGKDGAIKSKFYDIKNGDETLADLLDRGDARGFVDGLEDAPPNSCQKEWSRVGAVRSLTNTLAEMLRNIGGSKKPLVVMHDMNDKLAEQYVKRNVDKNDVEFILEALGLNKVTKMDGNRLMLYMANPFSERAFNEAKKRILKKETDLA